MNGSSSIIERAHFRNTLSTILPESRENIRTLRRLDHAETRENPELFHHRIRSMKQDLKLQRDIAEIAMITAYAKDIRHWFFCMEQGLMSVGQVGRLVAGAKKMAEEDDREFKTAVWRDVQAQFLGIVSWLEDVGAITPRAVEEKKGSSSEL